MLNTIKWSIKIVAGRVILNIFTKQPIKNEPMFEEINKKMSKIILNYLNENQSNLKIAKENERICKWKRLYWN